MKLMITEVKEVSRIAKAGEYIRLKKQRYSFNIVGDILKVGDTGDIAVGVLAERHPKNRKSSSPGYDKDFVWYYKHEEYIVLENYVAEGEEELWKTLLQ